VNVVLGLGVLVLLLLLLLVTSFLTAKLLIWLGTLLVRAVTRRPSPTPKKTHVRHNPGGEIEIVHQPLPPRPPPPSPTPPEPGKDGPTPPQ
jgi:hypothetical protein